MFCDRPKPPLDLTLLHSGSPADHTFRGSTEFRDGLFGPGSAAWAAESGRPAGLPLLARGAFSDMLTKWYTFVSYSTAALIQVALIRVRWLPVIVCEQVHLAFRSLEVDSTS
eukprot:COSAG02_NODE_3986_length_5948_cov_1.918619_7_plen_112_part_00